MITTDELVPVILLCNEEYWAPYVFESIKGRFERYVIYDVGSHDETKRIVNWFIETVPQGTEIFYRELPMCDPIIQGTFRNSMMAEARADWTLMIDGDEVYTPEALDALILEMENMKELYTSHGKTYGVVRRVEATRDLTKAYGQDLTVSHHRVYQRNMVFIGTHPGEEPLYKQNGNSEHWFSKKVVCYHQHNCARSRLDGDVPRRLKRRDKATYSPGEALPIDILEKVPLFRNPIEDFVPNPKLVELQKKFKL